MRIDIKNLKQNIVSLKQVVCHWKQFEVWEKEKSRLENKLQMRSDQLEETLESIKTGKDINAKLKDQLTKFIQIQEESMRTQSLSMNETRAHSKKSEENHNNSEKLKESILKIRKK